MCGGSVVCRCVCVCVLVRVFFIKSNNGKQTIIKRHQGLFDSVNRTTRVWGVLFVCGVLFSVWGVLCIGGGESVGAHA